MPRLAARLLLLVGSSAISLLLAESVLRLFFHAAPQLEVDIYRRDDESGLALRPNIQRRHVTPYWDFEIELNAAGMRDGPPPDPNEPIWLGLGDSFAFGWGVAADDTYYARIARALRVRLVNAAVPGTGPTDQLQRLERLADRWKLRVALESIFVGNDFTDAALGGVAQYEVVEGLLTRKPAWGDSPESNWQRWLARHSHLAQLVRAVQFNLRRGPKSRETPRRWDSWMREFTQVHLRAPNARTRRGVRVTLQALDGMLALCRRRGAELLLVALPRSIQVYPAELAHMLEALELSPADIDLDQPQRILRRWAKERGVALIDPLERMRRCSERGARLFYAPDAHMTAEGHRVVAAEALEVLRTRQDPD